MFQANTNASLKNLETQVGQLALAMQNQSKDAFPNDTRKNPKDCMVVTLRSEREIEGRKEKEKKTEEEKEEIGEELKQYSFEVAKQERSAKKRQKQQADKRVLKKKEEVQAYKPQVPFPQRLQKAKLEEQFSRFLNMFKKMEVNIPFSEALTQMPHYAKFMTDILSRKRKIAEGVVNLTTTYSAVIQRSLPKKMQDPGSFTIPCTIGNFEMGKALCDSGSNINLMPLSIVKRLSLGELTPTTITLQMKDITLAQPESILEDVLIKVGKFIFLLDFVVIDIEEDKQVPRLLGRPFLAIRATLIDVKKGELTLRVGDEAVHFNLNHSLKQLEFDNVDCKIVETKVPISSELINDCMIQNSMNENKMNFQYLDVLDVEFLNSNFESKEAVLSIDENSTEKLQS